MSRKVCDECGSDIPYDGSAHDNSVVCHTSRELRKIRKRGLIAVSPPATTGREHTNRAGTIAVCKILKLDYKLVASKARKQPWVCVTPEVEGTLRAVFEAAKYTMLVTPEAARRLVDKRDVLIEFDTYRRLGANGDDLFAILALAGIAGERAQFEARCTQRNPNRSDLSIRRAWEKFKLKRRRLARNLKTKP